MSAKQYVDLPGITVYDEEIKDYIEDKRPELTYAQYQALPSSKLTDGKEYFIKDITAISADINDSITALDSTWSSSKISSTVPFIVSGVLEAGETSITLSNEGILTTSFVDVYTGDGTPYNEITQTTGSVALTFDAQESDLNVSVLVSNYYTFSV